MNYTRCALIACVLFLFVSCSSQSSDSSSQVQSELKYHIVAREDVSYLGTPRMVFRVMLEVAEIPTEESMRALADELWNNGNKDWKEFTVFLYLPTMDTSFLAYGIAEYRPHGLQKFEISTLAVMDTKWEN